MGNLKVGGNFILSLKRKGLGRKFRTKIRTSKILLLLRNWPFGSEKFRFLWEKKGLEVPGQLIWEIESGQGIYIRFNCLTRDGVRRKLRI